MSYGKIQMKFLPNSIQGFNIGCVYTMAYNIQSINLEILLSSFSHFLKRFHSNASHISLTLVSLKFSSNRGFQSILSSFLSYFKNNPLDSINNTVLEKLKDIFIQASTKISCFFFKGRFLKFVL